MEQLIVKFPFTDNFRVQEAYKALRTNLLFCGQDYRVIMVTSAGENEGKTTTSLNLARSMAELGKQVLLIDTDMRKSVFASRYIKVKKLKGLSEVLTGMAKLSECIYSTQDTNLHILTAGKYPPNPVELLGSKYFHAVVSYVKEHYDYVIIDTPPLSRVIDAAVVAPVCDGAVIVLGDKVRASEAKMVHEQLEKTDCRVLGVIRNFVTEKNSRMYTY